jgi:hypothetical protein
MRKAGAAVRERVKIAYSRLPLELRLAVDRTRLRVRAGRLVADDWAGRPARDADRYWDSSGQAHRGVLLEQLRGFGSPESVLELGSHSGPNLRLAAEALPAARVAGIEINEAVVDRARLLLDAAGLGRVELTKGSVVELLPRWASDSEDLVFSCFALAYLSPRQLTGVLRHALRVAHLGIVLVEPHAGDGHRAGLMRGTDGWRHDYVTALCRLGVDRRSMRMVEVPNPPALINGCLVVDLRPSLP